jgi:hypothetical protein
VLAAELTAISVIVISLDTPVDYVSLTLSLPRHYREAGPKGNCVQCTRKAINSNVKREENRTNRNAARKSKMVSTVEGTTTNSIKSLTARMP